MFATKSENKLVTLQLGDNSVIAVVFISILDCKLEFIEVCAVSKVSKSVIDVCKLEFIEVWVVSKVSKSLMDVCIVLILFCKSVISLELELIEFWRLVFVVDCETSFDIKDEI